MIETEILMPGKICKHCHGTYGIHIVTCEDFCCTVCKRKGPDEDHRGGCPTLRQDEIRWTCQCGKSGWMRPTNFSLASQVRQARRKHKCVDPDIERLETRPEYERRLIEARIHGNVF